MHLSIAPEIPEPPVEKMDHSDEKEYLDLIKHVMEHGEERETRNATTISSFGHQIKFDLSESFPILTTKRMYFRGVVEELLWFLRGDTNNKRLKDKNVHIWDGNTTREFLDSRDLKHYPIDCCGPIYGYQWRHFNAEYYGCDQDYSEQGIDQLANVIKDLKDNPHSRRAIISGWNPCPIGRNVPSSVSRFISVLYI